MEQKTFLSLRENENKRKFSKIYRTKIPDQIQIWKSISGITEIINQNIKESLHNFISIGIRLPFVFQ